MKRSILAAIATILSALPSWAAAPRVGITAANTYFNGLPNETRAAIPTNSTGEITALAAALEGDAALIVAYVKNHFRYTPYYGHMKGPHETLMDQAGNDYDLTRLTIELLRAAGHTANYMRGTITYPQADAGKWLGVSTTQVSPLLCEAGVPHNAPSAGTIAIERIWVRVNGVDVDPGFKEMVQINGVNLGALMGYNQTTLLNEAAGDSGTTSGAAWVKDVKEDKVEARLQTWTTNLLNGLRTNHPNSTMSDILGGYEIVPVQVTKGNLAALAITASGASATTPDAKRMHTVKITVGAEEKIISMPDLDGRIFCVSSTPGSAQPSNQTPNRFQVKPGVFPISIASVAEQAELRGRIDFEPVIQGAKHQYFTFAINKNRNSGATDGSDQIEIEDNPTGAFKLNATDGSASTLAVNPSASTNLYFATSAAVSSYTKSIHVYVPKTTAPGSYEATLKVTDYSENRSPQETIIYEIPLFATVLPNHVMQLKVGSTVVWSDSTVAAQDRTGSYELKVAINHPYPANSGTHADQEPDPDRIRRVFRGSKYVFLTQAGDARWTGKRVSAPLNRCSELLNSGANQQSEEVNLNTLSAFGSQYLLESELVGDLAARIANTSLHNHHQFAIAKLEAGYVMDHIMWSPWAVGRSGTVDERPIFESQSMFGSALEHASSEQFQDAEAISTIKALYRANASGQKIYKVDATNLSSIESELTGFASRDLDYYQQRATEKGITYVIHQDGSSILNDWKGHGYMEIHSYGGRGMLIGSGFNFQDPTYGGVSTVRFQHGFDWDTLTRMFNLVNWGGVIRPYGFRQGPMSAEPVDLKTGAYVYNMTELTVGTTAPPRGLDFQRSYNSDAASISGPLGRGWDHNWNSRISTTTDPSMGMGMRHPADAAAWIVATHTMRQLLTSNQNTPKGLVVQAIVSTWAVDQLKDNSASVKLAGEAAVFAKQPDGSYTPPPGSKLTLIKNGTSGHLLKNRFGSTFTFDATGKFTGISDIYNKTLSVGWDGDNVDFVQDAYDRRLDFEYGGDTLLDSVTDSTGRSMSFTYLGGNLATFTDPDSNVFRYTYDDDNRLQEFRNGENEVVAFNHYDSQGKVEFQNSEGDINRQWRFFITPFRTVQQDPLGGQTIYEYDRWGRQIAQTDALGHRQTFDYNVHDLLTAAVDAKQQRTEFGYDNRLNLTLTRKFKDGLPVETGATYDGLNRQDSVTNANGHSVTYSYNALHEKEWEEDPDGNRTTYTYYPTSHAAAGQLETVTVPGENGATHTTTYFYDNYGHLDRIDYPDNTSEDFTYSTRGDLTHSEDRKNHVWQYFYYNRRLLHREVDPNLEEKIHTYNSYGKLLTFTDRNGHQSINTYYPAGRLKDSTNAQQETTVYEYDLRDWPKKVISPLLHEVESTYYANGWTDQIFDPLDQATKNFYQPNGNREKVRNALLQDTTFGFDDLDRVENVTDTRNVQTVSTLDNAGNTRFFENGRNHEAESVFDKLNRVTDFYTPLRRHTHRVYSPRGLLTSITEPSSQSAAFIFDEVGRVDSLTDDLGTIDYDYDDNGNLETVTEGGKSITREYDNLNRLELYRNGEGEEIEYRYYPEGQLWKIIYPDKTKVVEYAYDDANRLKTVTDWNNRVTTYNWDEDGRLESIDRDNGTHRVLAYDAAGRTKSIREIGGNGKLINFYQFERDPLGRVKHEVRGPRPPPYGTETQAATFDADDRLATYGGVNVTHDDDGNMTFGPVSADEWQDFNFDARNRLTSVDDSSVWENVYDAEGIRVEVRNEGAPTKFVVSPGTLPKTLVQINPDNTRRYFVYGLGLLYHIDGDDENTSTPLTTTTYHYNAQGSTIALSNDSGISIGRFHYDPYGLVVAKHGEIDTIFQFNGHYGIATDPTGLVHLNARFYSPFLKRFMNSDPAGFAGGTNWFAYSSGDPINQFDPLGLGPADSERYTWIDGMQDGIGVGGMFPGLGAIPDGVNGVIYLFRGKWGDALFSFGSAVPIAGDFVAAGKYADRLNDVRRAGDGINPNIGGGSIVGARFEDEIFEVMTKGELEVPGMPRDFTIRHLMADMTSVTGREVGLFRLSDGRRVIRMGDETSVGIGADVKRIIAHTHPSGLTGFSGADLFQLGSRGHRSSVVIDPVSTMGSRNSVLWPKK